MANYGSVPQVDFSTLGDLGKTYKAAQSEATLADLGQRLSSGQIDYREAAGLAAKAGKLDVSLSLLKLGQEEEAIKQFNSNFGGGPPTPSPGGGTQPPPSTGVPLSSIGRPSAPPQPPMAPGGPPVQQATEGIISAIPDSGPNAGRDIAPQINAAVPPQRVAQAPTIPNPQTPNPAAANIQRLIALMPRLPAGQRDAAKAMLEHALKSSDLTEQQKDFERSKIEPSFKEYQTDIKSAGVQGRAQTKFDESMDASAAKRWDAYIAGGDAASKSMVDINNMREISRRMGSQGAAANVKEFIGPYAEALGINIEGLSDIQAYTSIIQRLAPQQRAPGSGATSDIEFKGFLRSLPGLMQNPAAREATLDTMEALARHQQAEGEIASRLGAKEINRKQAEIELRRLPDPMSGFRAWRKANPNALSAQPPPPASSNQPAAQPQAAPVRVNTQAERDALPSGTRYIAPDGTERTKP